MKRADNLYIKAIIFDMDGVITNTMPYHFDAWKTSLAKRGIEVNCYDVYKREGQRGKETIKEICREHRSDLSRAEQDKVLSEKERIFNATVKIKFIKGSRPFLRKLKNRGFFLSIVTGTSRKEVKKILPKNIYDLFDVIITADEVSYGKPHPEPFLLALNNLGIAKKDAVVIENAPFGIESAKKAGLYCIAIETSLPGKFLKGADRVFRSIAQLQERVNFINSKR
ncbi:MAG: HAD family phosphatase [Candidatus Omnitrophica bacterium]|nr:HAD family phosphatase [Candidatus Omnitrophota bacterium]MDD5236997.1 HAD family phosphatase [Candidatus Omnitrophota bacterium]MDD5609978.1 HAD family phosphatase [Candidatus Omnitrophota bacterium]